MEIFEHYRRILQKMMQKDEWVEWLQYPECSETKYFTNTIYCATGVSRCALVDEEYDWIIKWDYQDYEFCDKEEIITKSAIHWNIDDMIAPALYIGKYIDEENYICLNLYAYPRAISFSSSQYKGLSKEEKKITAASPLAERSEYIAAAFIQDWGIEKFELLSDFCKEWDINDIHNGNVGIVDGKIVLIDYAGFHSGDSYYSDEENPY